MFQRINPDKLNGRQKEIYNFQQSAALLADYGFNCIKLSDDWQGTDFLAHHFDGRTTLKVQLEARLTVDRKVHRPRSMDELSIRWQLVPGPTRQARRDNRTKHQLVEHHVVARKRNIFRR